jgi:hypothetical protein
MGAKNYRVAQDQAEGDIDWSTEYKNLLAKNCGQLIGLVTTHDCKIDSSFASAGPWPWLAYLQPN